MVEGLAGWLVVGPERRKAGDDHGTLVSSDWRGRGGGVLGEEREVRLRVVVQGDGRVGRGHRGGRVGRGDRGEEGEHLVRSSYGRGEV